MNNVGREGTTDIHNQHYGNQTGYTFQQPGTTAFHAPTPPSDEALGMFRQMDVDNTGQLSWEETWRKMTDNGLADHQIEEFFLAVDQNHDGIIDQAEFCSAYMRYQSYFVHAPPPQTQKAKLELWYNCPACARTIVNNTGSNTFACPYCTAVIQGVPSEDPVTVQQTTLCSNSSCQQILLVPQDKNGAAFVFACSKCGEVMTAGNAPSVGTTQTVQQMGGVNKHNHNMSHGPTESAMQNMLWEAFVKHDANRGGSICKAELHQLLGDLNFPVNDVDTEFAKADVNHDKQIDFNEFAIYYNDLLVRMQTNSSVATTAVSADQLNKAKDTLAERQTELEKKQEKAAIKESKYLHELQELQRELEDAKQVEAAKKLSLDTDQVSSKAEAALRELEQQDAANAIRESEQMAELEKLKAELEARKAIQAVADAEAAEAVVQAAEAEEAEKEAEVAAVAAVAQAEKETEEKKKHAEDAKKMQEMQDELEEVRRERLAYKVQADIANQQANTATATLEEHLHAKQMEIAILHSKQEELDREQKNTEIATQRVVAQAAAAHEEQQEKYLEAQEANKKRVEEMKARRAAK